MPDEVQFSERLWSEEIGLVDPDALSTAKPVAYQWSNGATFKDGPGHYEQPE